MATAASKMTHDNPTAASNQSMTADSGKDVVESTLRTFDQSTKQAAGVSLFHILTLASIGGSLALLFVIAYLKGRAE